MKILAITICVAVVIPIIDSSPSRASGTYTPPPPKIIKKHKKKKPKTKDKKDEKGQRNQK